MAKHTDQTAPRPALRDRLRNARPQAPLSPEQRARLEAQEAAGERRGVKRKPSHDPHRRAVLLVSIPLAVATLAFAGLTLYNHVLGGGSAFQPYTTAAAQAIAAAAPAGSDSAGDANGTADTSDKDGADESGAGATQVSVDVSYISEIVEANNKSNALGLVETTMAWDDAWFTQDVDTYNHALARTCAVLSAVVNSESAFYGGRTTTDFAVETLGELGFDDVQSDSYIKRSEAGDEVAAIFTGKTNVTAYVFAHKTLADGRELVLVGVRGTYGSEWLSNFNFAGGGTASFQHEGFAQAADEILTALDAYCADNEVDTTQSAILVLGHSRGGAVANLIAAALDAGEEAESGEGRAVDEDSNEEEVVEEFAVPSFERAGIYAYTFAAPNATQDDSNADDPQYTNIFNVVNSTDLVPRLPLSAWGWTRYGITVGIPEPGASAYAPCFEAMQARRGENTGYYNTKSPFVDATSNVIEDVAARIAQKVPDDKTFMTFNGIVSTLTALGTLDIGQVVASHYPDTYIAWLETIDEADLTIG